MIIEIKFIMGAALAVGGVTVQAVLKEDGLTAVAGRTLTFSTGNQTVKASTGANGLASAKLDIPVGKYSLKVSFDGDNYFQRTSATQTVFVYQPTQFVGNPPANRISLQS